jgi:hypothetical protein
MCSHRRNTSFIKAQMQQQSLKIELWQQMSKLGA